jgi:hypothetical protein
VERVSKGKICSSTSRRFHTTPTTRTEGTSMPRPPITEKEVESAKKVLHEVRDSREWEDYDDPSMILEQLVPYATLIAEHEGHGDFNLVMERELEL